jgi:hypothetical protein
MVSEVLFGLWQDRNIIVEGHGVEGTAAHLMAARKQRGHDIAF